MTNYDKLTLRYDRRSVGQSVSVSSTHRRAKTRFLLLSDSCGFVDVGRHLWREGASVAYNWCRSSPAQSFPALSPAWLMTIFYWLRFETPPTRRARSPYLYPPEQGGPVIPPGMGSFSWADIFKSTVCWDVTPCGWEKAWSFGGTHSGSKSKKINK
jgi:hypothetical protein